MIVLILLLFLLSVSAINAAEDATDDIISTEIDDTITTEIDDTVTLEEDESNVNLEEIENEELNSADDNPKLTETSTKTFKELDDAINNNWDAVIDLTCNYTYTDSDGDGFKDGIDISRPVTINGNGITIDGAGKARIFTVMSDNVIFNNITFKNGNTTNDGGAIDTTNHYTANYCTFTNNTADRGGAMYKGTANNCTFTNNNADKGGAMYYGTANNCTFTNNTADRGGAINDVTANNCTFTNNTAYNGGAMTYGTANNCTFTNNTAYNGGAIDEGTANNCTFTNNTAYNGGAINGGDATYCTFTNNTATNCAGAINGGDATYCTFTDNTAYLGGAMYYGTANNCIFLMHTQEDAVNTNGKDTCIFCSGTPVLDASNFISSNSSGDKLSFNVTCDGSAIDGVRTKITIYQNDEEVKSFYAFSGEGWVVDLDPGVYKARLSLEHEDITPFDVIMKVTDGTTFWDLNQTINKDPSATEIILTHDYKFNPETDYGFYQGFDQLSYDNLIQGINITHKITIDGKNHTIDGANSARIFMIGYSSSEGLHPVDGVTIKNINFINGWCGQYGGAIGGYGENLTLTGNTFTNNQVYDEGGAICWMGDNGNITGNTFTNNSARLGTFVKGGAISWYGNNGTLTGNTFTNNQAEQDTMHSEGGAIYWKGDNGNITGNTFTNNQAKGYMNIGGAISLSGNNGNITGNTFTNNTADEGGAIYLNYYNNVVNYNIFLNNGDTLYQIASNYNVSSNWFGNNATNYTAKPAISNTIELNDWLFLNATASKDKIELFDTSDIIFKLFSYNSADQENPVTEIDNKLLPANNLTISATKGTIANDASFGDTLKYKAAELGEASATATFKDIPCTIELSNTKIITNLTAKSVTATYNENKDLVIILKDSKGNAMEGATVSVDLDGAKNYTTDKNGEIRISIANLVPKTYTVKISYEGNDNYFDSSSTAKVTVKKITTAITAKAKTFKYEDKTKKYTITLKNNEGKVMKKAKVTLKVNGKTYTAKTNSKGVATFKLKKLTKKGKYNAVITYAGNKYYKKATKKAKITVKAPAKKKTAWKTLAKGSKGKATVKKIQKALKDNGYYLTYKGRYLKIDGIYHDYTERAVKQFQKAKGLKVTGKVDYKTAKKLKIV